ncbi:MAG: hypothetical protein AAGE98_04690 [Actinomycetota bacterium]
MTDNTDAFDELVSRYLDAEATADEIARVESDPALLARADEVRAAMAAVAAPVDIPTADLDRIRAAAIAAGTTTPAVTDLAAARVRKLERRNRFLAVAAAFVFIAVGFAAVQNLSTGGDDDEATDASASSESASASEMADSATADEALEMFTDDDDMAEEEADGDMAEATAESDMAEADDMAEEAADEMLEEDLATEDGGGDDAAAAERAGIDVLPDQLEPVASIDDLLVVIDEAYADVVDAPFLGEPFFAVCSEVIDLIVERQDDRTVNVEQAVVMVADELLNVIVALDFAGQRLVITHPIDDCAVSSVVSPEPP